MNYNITSGAQFLSYIPKEFQDHDFFCFTISLLIFLSLVNCGLELVPLLLSASLGCISQALIQANQPGKQLYHKNMCKTSILLCRHMMCEHLRVTNDSHSPLRSRHAISGSLSSVKLLCTHWPEVSIHESLLQFGDLFPPEPLGKPLVGDMRLSARPVDLKRTPANTLLEGLSFFSSLSFSSSLWFKP